nr:DUF6233 domain-containing protein [Streptomyces adustus]
MLRFARRVVAQQAAASLAQIDGWIATEERREAERLRGEEARPEPPKWVVEQGLNRDNVVAVHQGRCWDAGKRRRPVTRDQAVEALRQQVPACTHCRPDTALGILE